MSGGTTSADALVPVQGTEAGTESSDSSEEKSPAERAAAAKIKKTFNAPAYWMIAFGSILAISAGIVNVTCILHLGTVVSHMTGVTSKIGLHLEGVRVAEKATYYNELAAVNSTQTTDTRAQHTDLFVEEVWILLSFIFGAFLCGLVIPKNSMKFGGKGFYGIALLGNCALLIVAYVLALDEDTFAWAASFAACASGLQNAMCTMHLGAVVRTTHVTGTVTDIGSTSGRAVMILLRALVSGRKMGYLDRVEFGVDVKKLKVLLTIFFSFSLGCYLGALLYTHLLLKAMLVPAAITGVLGLIYTFLRGTFKRHLKKYEKDKVDEEMGEAMEVLETAQRMVSRQKSKRDGEDVGAESRAEIFDQVEHALEVLHGLQDAIGEIDPDTDDEDSEDAPRREPSHHSFRSHRSKRSGKG